MSDLVERLRMMHNKAADEAADEIDRLRAEVDRYGHAFKHTHINKQDGTDTCAKCGLDLRDRIHYWDAALDGEGS